MRPLPGVTILSVREPDDRFGGTVVVTAEFEDDPSLGPSRGWRRITLTDLDSGDNPVLWNIRYRRREGATSALALLDVRHPAHPGMTARVPEVIAINGLRQPYPQVAKRFAVSERTVMRICDTARRALEHAYRPRGCRVLGIDEAHVHNRKRTVLSNAETGEALEILEGQSYQAVVAALRAMQDRHLIDVVVMDFWAPYAKAVRAVLGKRVRIVIDRWHVEKQFKQVLDTLIAAQQKAEKQVKNTKKIRRQQRLFKELLRTKENKMCEAEKFLLEHWGTQDPVIGEAHAALQCLLSIFNRRYTRAAALEAYEAWRDGLSERVRALFDAPIKLVDQRQASVFAYFDTRVTGGQVEKLNDFIKDRFRESPGGSFALLRARVLANHGPWTATMIAEAFAGGQATATASPCEAVADPTVPNTEPSLAVAPVPPSPPLSVKGRKRQPDPRQLTLFGVGMAEVA